MNSFGKLFICPTLVVAVNVHIKSLKKPSQVNLCGHQVPLAFNTVKKKGDAVILNRQMYQAKKKAYTLYMYFMSRPFKVKVNLGPTAKSPHVSSSCESCAQENRAMRPPLLGHNCIRGWCPIVSRWFKPSQEKKKYS